MKRKKILLTSSIRKESLAKKLNVKVLKGTKEEENVGGGAKRAMSRRCNHSHAPIRLKQTVYGCRYRTGPVFMMRMSAPVVTLATERPATNPSWSRAQSVLWRADSLTHTFLLGISYSQVIYDAYIALGERHLYPRRRLFLGYPLRVFRDEQILETWIDWWNFGKISIIISLPTNEI